MQTSTASMRAEVHPGSDEVLFTTRLLAAFIIPFLAAASVILVLVPDETERFFAWGIGPSMTAMVLGSTYAGGIVFFARVTAARRWSSVALGFPSVITFATTLGLVTLLNWDAFTHDHVAFWAWSGLYFTTPVLVMLVWLKNRAAAGSAGRGVLMSPMLRGLLAVLGISLVGVSLALLVFPTTMADVWVWTLSPLTARTLAAAFLLPAVLNVAVALDGRWLSARVPFEAQIVALALVLLSTARARSDFDAPVMAVVGFAAGLVGLFAISVAIYARAGRRAKR